jgi:hypothetical protein
MLDALERRNSAIFKPQTTVAALGALFLLTGLVAPGALIASSPAEFSFIAPYKSPFPFIAQTALQAMGVFLFWGGALYAFFGARVRAGMTLVLAAAVGAALVDAFAFPGDYGFLTTTLSFSNATELFSPGAARFVNLAVLVAVVGVVALAASRRNRALSAGLTVVVMALATLAV